MDKTNLISLLFDKPIPNHTIPFPTDGYKIYGCNACGDKFIFESSYQYHIGREVLDISLNCRKCNKVLRFKNRCKFIDHLTLHFATKTLTINPADLNVGLLPEEHFAESTRTPHRRPKRVPNSAPIRIQPDGKQFQCAECGVAVQFGSAETLYAVRAQHYATAGAGRHSCPVCLYALPSRCALLVHLRLHRGERPHVCPDCGKALAPTRSVLHYPFSHECAGFRMMRVSARMRCPSADGCAPLHPAEFARHLRLRHARLAVQCGLCPLDFPDEKLCREHARAEHPSRKATPLKLYGCLLCKKTLKTVAAWNSHLKTHYVERPVFPCWSCRRIFEEPSALIDHAGDGCGDGASGGAPGKMYSVSKRCERCRRVFCYKCREEDIAKLPSECPHCDSGAPPRVACPLCRRRVPSDPAGLDAHFLSAHNRSMNARLLLRRCRTPRAGRARAVGVRAGPDPCAAYRCLECGQCFGGRRSFSAHLLIEHGVTDIDLYLSRNRSCYNEDALRERKKSSSPEPILDENQCKICFERFCNAEDLQKHFRVHGMAFLLEKTKNNSKHRQAIDPVQV